jgi:hypothetical protein
MYRSTIALVATLALFQTADAHDRWDSGEQVPVWGRPSP